MKINQGNYEDRLVKERLKIGTTIVDPYGDTKKKKQERG